MGKSIMEVLLWTFIGSMAVLVVTHAPGFAQAVTAVGGQVNNIDNTLTGTNVKNAVYSKAFTN
jgi:hypothetical protein